MSKRDGIARQHSFYFTPWIVFLWHQEFYLLILRLETACMYWIYHHAGRREFSLDLYKCKSTWILLLLDELRLLSFPRMGLLRAAQLPLGLGYLWDMQREAVSWTGGNSRVLPWICFLQSLVLLLLSCAISFLLLPPTQCRLSQKYKLDELCPASFYCSVSFSQRRWWLIVCIVELATNCGFQRTTTSGFFHFCVFVAVGVSGWLL